MKEITKGDVRKLLSENGWMKYAITTQKWTKQRAISWLEQRYQPNLKLNELINQLKTTETDHGTL